MTERTDIGPVTAPSLFETLRRPRALAPADEDGAEACAAFGYVRGLADRAVSLELRFRTGNRESYPYALLAGCRFDPSAGLLLKFTADVTTLVLVRGSNLDLPVNSGAVDLIERGLGRQRVLWVREMDADEIRRAGAREPTVDRIEVGECESAADVREWLRAHAPAFVRDPAGA